VREKLQMSKHIFKRLTLAQCVDVHCRPIVERCRPLHSAYWHTPLMCIMPWQSGAYALKRSALYRNGPQRATTDRNDGRL